MGSEQERAVRQAVADERARIARELHDLVAHSVSVMVVQAGGIRCHLEPHQERARTALRTIEETGREALEELRRLAGILADGDEGVALSPQPDLAALGTLVDRARGEGVAVSLRVEGEPYATPPGVGLSAYRLVQEAIDGARRGGPGEVTIVLGYAERGIELRLEGEGLTGIDADGECLAVMQERVAYYGGSLEAGVDADGRPTVRALVPIPGNGRES